MLAGYAEKDGIPFETSLTSEYQAFSQLWQGLIQNERNEALRNFEASNAGQVGQAVCHIILMTNLSSGPTSVSALTKQQLSDDLLNLLSGTNVDLMWHTKMIEAFCKNYLQLT